MKRYFHLVYNLIEVKIALRYCFAIFFFASLSFSCSLELTKQNPPALPTDLRVVGASSTILQIAWNASEDTDYYKLFRDTIPSGSFTHLCYLGNNTMYFDTGLQDAKTYYYKIKAFNSNGSSPLSDYISGTTTPGGFPPPTPALFTIGNASINSLRISWNASPGADSYRVFRDLSESGSFGLVAYNGASTAFTDFGLASGTTYYYKVQASNTYGDSALSTAASGTTLSPVPPLTPTGLYTTHDTTSTTIRWDSSLTATSYQLFRDTSASGDFSLMVYDGVSDSFTDSIGIALGVAYYYKVQASNAFGSSELSSAVIGGTPPGIPSGLTVNNPATKSLTISWDETSNVEGYQLFKDTTPSGSFINKIYEGTDTSYTDTGLQYYTSYYYKIRAFNQFGYSILSFWASGTTLKPDLATPNNVQASTGLGSKIQVTWNPVPYATSYEIYVAYSINPITYWRDGTTTTTSYEFFVLTRDPVLIKVRAWDGGRVGPFSDPVYGSR